MSKSVTPTHNLCTVDTALVNQNTNSSLQNQNVHPYDQSTVILQQFSMITQELRNVTDRVSGDINKITQACTAAQENTGKLVENATSQVLTKPQDIMPSNPAIDSRTLEANCASNSSYEDWTTSWQTNNFGIPQHPSNEAYHSERPYETHVSPHAYVGQHPPNPTSLILINL